MTNQATHKFDPAKPDAVFDLDGTVFKFTTLEQYINWLCQQGVFEPLPAEVNEARMLWKRGQNTEENYNLHTGLLVRNFITQIAGKPTEKLVQAAEILAPQIAYRRWDIAVNIMKALQPTHNIIAISLMPEWLVGPFTRDLGFVARLGSTYVQQDGSFTGEAYSIDKAKVYTEYRHGDTSRLDVAMGDTVGDRSIFKLARRPIAFNPSFTLSSAIGKHITTVSAWKDAVMVSNNQDAGKLFSQRFHCSQAGQVLAMVQSQR